MTPLIRGAVMCVTCAFINPFGGDGLHEKDIGRTLTETSDVPSNTSTNVQLFAGDTFNGTIGFPGDWDWFYVEFEAGVTYTITLTPGTLDDPIFRQSKLDWADSHSRVIFTHRKDLHLTSTFLSGVTHDA